ncbi:MAG: hypothetical protein JWQ01_4936 [Massilia sp.]|nr:hypothetical protein [Massilia sp.]
MAPAAASPQPTPTPASNEPPAAAAAPTRPEFLPEALWDSEKGGAKIDALAPVLAELNDLKASAAVEASRKATLPTDAAGYKIELPADFTPPEGVTFEFNADDPLLARARDLAHAKGIDQETFSQMLGLYAGAQIQDQTVIAASKNAEIAKLGVNGPARVDAVTNWLTAVGGDDAATLIKVMDYAPVAGTVVAFENLMRKFSSQGAGGFSQAHRDAPNNKLTEEEYSALSYAEKREYTTTGKRPQRAA